MVVTLDAAGLAAALRIGDSAEELAEATRLLDYASTAITRHVETCPDAIHNEAVRRPGGIPAGPTRGRTWGCLRQRIEELRRGGDDVALADTHGGR